MKYKTVKHNYGLSLTDQDLLQVFNSKDENTHY